MGKCCKNGIEKARFWLFLAMGLGNSLIDGAIGIRK